MSVLVFVEISDNKISKAAGEAVHYASKLGEAVALTYGDADESTLASLGNFGASKVLVCRELSQFDVARAAVLVASVGADVNADQFVFQHDFTGKALAPRVAAKLKAAFIPGVSSYPDLDNGFVAKRAVFSGKAFAAYKALTDKKVLSLLPNSIDVSKSETAAPVESTSVNLPDSRIKVKEFRKKGGEGVLLTEADIVVSGGRGLKAPENFKMIEELAEILGAATACTRPVADVGWRPHHEHVGQTGLAIRPNLYIAIGISGAIQHLAGVNGSKIMVVVNTDPEAPFFKAADYGIIGDAFIVVPKLIEAAKKLKEDS